MDSSEVLGEWLFGNVHHVSGGLLLEPVAPILIEPRGHGIGGPFSDDFYWRACLGGVALFESRFSLVPSITFDRREKGMLLGLSNKESSAPVEVCLLPKMTLPGSDELLIVISSCLPFYAATAPPLISALIQDGFECDQILIVVNGSSRRDPEYINGVEVVFTTHEAWEYSALYVAPIGRRFDWAFLLHDTCEILPGFRRAILSANGSFQWDWCPAQLNGLCNLGLYSRDFLLRINHQLELLHGMSKNDAIAFETTGQIQKRSRLAYSYGGHDCPWDGSATAPNGSAPRQGRVFPSVKVRKLIHSSPYEAREL